MRDADIDALSADGAQGDPQLWQAAVPTDPSDADLRRLAEDAIAARGDDEATEADDSWLAAANPQTILALLDERDAIEAETNRKWNEGEGTVWHYCGHEDDSHVDAAERRVAALEKAGRAVLDSMRTMDADNALVDTHTLVALIELIADKGKARALLGRERGER